MKKINPDIQNIIAVSVVVAIIVFIYILFNKKIPEGNETIINVFAGAILIACSRVMDYYFQRNKNDDQSGSAGG